MHWNEFYGRKGDAVKTRWNAFYQGERSRVWAMTIGSRGETLRAGTGQWY